MERLLRAHIHEAVGAEKAFGTLAPGCQRSCVFYFSSAKQSKTRAAKLEKNIDRIMEGKGLEDEKKERRTMRSGAVDPE